ncbi:SSXT family protein [Tasmannia lanceolata]|uniref:SSXT family protein n=1 Tax=Tasmannia lanceolata TaxID=3420 RepID=UPI004062BE00
MQQHLMQMQPMMGGYPPNAVTTDIIQQYLDENKDLILKILDNQNAGRLSECAENQAKLQRNLMYLAAIADSQPQPAAAAAMHPQYPPNAVVSQGGRYLQQQQAQQMTPQSLMAARSSMMYAQQQQQQQQQALHSQLTMNSGGNNGLHMMHNETSVGGNGGLSAGGFPDFSRNAGVTGASKQDLAISGAAEGRGGSARGHNGDGTEPMYLKGSEEEGN